MKELNRNLKDLNERLINIEKVLSINPNGGYSYELRSVWQSLRKLEVSVDSAATEDRSDHLKASKASKANGIVQDLISFFEELHATIKERDEKIVDLELELKDAQDVSGVSKVTSNALLINKMVAYDYARCWHTVSHWNAKRDGDVVHCHWTQRDKNGREHDFNHSFYIIFDDALRFTKLIELMNYWQSYFINLQIKIDAEADAKGGAE